MALLKGTKKGAPPAPRAEPLFQVVIKMRDQGVSDKEIVGKLREKGVSSSQILDAMKQADLKAAIKGGDAGGTDFGGDLGSMPDIPEFAEPSPAQYPSRQQYAAKETVSVTTEDIEEVVEEIISEKWKSVAKDLDDLKKWKDDSADSLGEIKEKVDGLADSLERLKASIAEQVNKYSQSIDDVTTEIKAMDKVFREIMPEFTDNVKQLSEAVAKIKKK